MGKRRGESIYNINNIVIHTLVAKKEKLQYKDIITPRYGSTASPRGILYCIHTHTYTNTFLIWQQTKRIAKYLYSWRVSDPSSVNRKEMEDEEGQVEPGNFGALVCSWMCLMSKRTLNLFWRRILPITCLHRDTWLWNAERNQLGLPGELENAIKILRGGWEHTFPQGACSRRNL